MAHTHDDIETIREKIAYRKHIRDLESETREVLERETSNKNNETWTGSGGARPGKIGWPIRMTILKL